MTLPPVGLVNGVWSFARWMSFCANGGAVVLDASGAVIGETGEVTTGHRGAFVLLPTPLADPVVILGPATARDEEPVLARVFDRSGGGFRARLQEWSHQDGEHELETFAFLALAGGRHVLPDGSVFEVGSLSLGDTERWRARAFSEAFAAPPALFLSVQTRNEDDPVVVRARDVTATGFEAALFEERESDGGHAAERVGFLAVGSPARSGRLGADGSLPYALRAITLDDRRTPFFSHSLWLEEDGTPDAENGHADERVDVLALGPRVFAQEVSALHPDAVAVRRAAPEHGARLEWGMLGDLDHNWQTVPLARIYENPVVVVRPVTAQGQDPAVARVRGARGDGFELRLQEWEYLDGVHYAPEQAFYLVAEAGVHGLAGLVVEAGRLESAQLVRNGWLDVALPAPLPEVPAVFASVMTQNDAAPVIVRTSDRTGSGFRMAMQEEERRIAGHGVETFGWIAVQHGRRVTDDGRVVRVFQAQADHTLTRIDFGETLRGRFPFLVGSIASALGTDPVELRYTALDPTGVVVFLQEEASRDAEITHAAEELSLFVAE
jgi:hypothetical protein